MKKGKSSAMSRNRRPSLDSQSGKVYIGGLGNGAETREVEEAFSTFGRLKAVWVARNPPGFAFVEFENHYDAEDAVRCLDGTRLNGRRVRVEISSGESRWKKWNIDPPTTRRSDGSAIDYKDIMSLVKSRKDIYRRKRRSGSDSNSDSSYSSHHRRSSSPRRKSSSRIPPLLKASVVRKLNQRRTFKRSFDATSSDESDADDRSRSRRHRRSRSKRSRRSTSKSKSTKGRKSMTKSRQERSGRRSFSSSSSSSESRSRSRSPRGNHRVAATALDTAAMIVAVNGGDGSGKTESLKDVKDKVDSKASLTCQCSCACNNCASIRVKHSTAQIQTDVVCFATVGVQCDEPVVFDQSVLTY